MLGSDRLAISSTTAPSHPSIIAAERLALRRCPPSPRRDRHATSLMTSLGDDAASRPAPSTTGGELLSPTPSSRQLYSGRHGRKSRTTPSWRMRSSMSNDRVARPEQVQLVRVVARLEPLSCSFRICGSGSGCRVLAVARDCSSGAHPRFDDPSGTLAYSGAGARPPARRRAAPGRMPRGQATRRRRPKT